MSKLTAAFAATGLAAVFAMAGLTVPWASSEPASTSPPLIKFSVKKKGGGSGSVVSIPAGIDCGSVCDAEFAQGTQVTFIATPDPGSEVTWNDGDCGQVENRCTLTISSPNSIPLEAHFDLPPPSGPVGISINDEAQYTNDPNVSISLVWIKGQESAKISNDGGFRHAKTVALEPEVPWKLDSSGAERLPKTLYVRYDNYTPTYQDDIILDETPPSLSSATATESGGSSSALRALAWASGARKVKLRTKASDKTSGLAKIQAGPKKSSKLKKIRYRKSVTIKASGKKLWVRVLDRAGNASKWKKVKVK